MGTDRKTSSATTVLFCNCAYGETIPEGVRREVLEALAGADLELVAVPDLCRWSARRDPRLKKIAAAKRLAVIACFPRVVRWLFHAAGSSLPSDASVLNMRTMNAASILAQLGIPAMKAKRVPPVGKDDEWVPWFPVIDYDLCVNCKQCLSYCPFGVYELSKDGKVTVVHPDHCKNNCPACARTCPQMAIMFPKFKDAPINGAAVPAKKDAAASTGGCDRMEALLAKRKERAAAFRRAREKGAKA